MWYLKKPYLIKAVQITKEALDSGEIEEFFKINRNAFKALFSGAVDKIISYKLLDVSILVEASGFHHNKPFHESIELTRGDWLVFDGGELNIKSDGIFNILFEETSHSTKNITLDVNKIKNKKWKELEEDIISDLQLFDAHANAKLIIEEDRLRLDLFLEGKSNTAWIPLGELESFRFDLFHRAFTKLIYGMGLLNYHIKPGDHSSISDKVIITMSEHKVISA